MLLSLFRCQLRHIHHEYINISTYILGGQQWHIIWRIRWNMTGYWRSLWLWRCVMWRSGWLLTNWGQMRCINDWIIKWRRHRYHRWWQLISLWVTVLAIKTPVITRSEMWWSGQLLTNRGYLTCSSPRRPLFLQALSFECTSKLCITFLNQFSVYFHI